MADCGNHRIRFINKYGYASTHAGDGRIGLKNGRLENSSFNHPSGICRSSQGHILISDSGNHVIRIATTQGMVKTYAGSGERGEKDGPANEATFNAPRDLCIDYQGQLYVCDSGNHRIRMISSSRVVSTVTGSTAGYRDGARDEALFNDPSCVRLTPSRLGTLLVADTGNHCIRLLANGYITTFAGCQNSGFHAAGRRSEALFHSPVSLAVSSDESVYVSDAGNHCIYHLSANGAVSILSGGTAGCQDGSKEQAAFKRPGGLCLVGQRQLILAETGHGRILVVKPDGSVANFAGRSRAGTVDGPVAKSTFFKPQALFSASSNDLLIADSMGNKIRRIRNGLVSTFAGSPERGASNGRRDLANFDGPTGLCISPANVVYVADTNNHLIRHISDGHVATFAGSGVAGFHDGPGTVAKFNFPIGLILLPSAMLVADSMNHRLRFITKDAVVSTYAGSEAGFKDSPNASEALFNCPTELAYGPDGCVYVSDHLNHAIRLIKPNGAVHTLVGLSGEEGNVDGPPSVALLSHPRGLTLAPDGSLIVADTGNRSVRIVSPKDRTTSTLVFWDQDEQEDPDANTDSEQIPTGLSLTNSGVLFIADMLRNQILYLPCPQWDLTRPIPKAKDYAQFFSLAELSHAPRHTFDFALTHKATGTSFHLHSFFVHSRCPMLLEPQILEIVQSVESVDTVGNLVRLLYSDHTMPIGNLAQLQSELVYICTLIEKPSWTSLLKYHISDFLTEQLVSLKRKIKNVAHSNPNGSPNANHPTPLSAAMDTSAPPSPSSSYDAHVELQSALNDLFPVMMHIWTRCKGDNGLLDLLMGHIKTFSRSSNSPTEKPRSRSGSWSGRDSPHNSPPQVHSFSPPPTTTHMDTSSHATLMPPGAPASSSTDSSMISFKLPRPASRHHTPQHSSDGNAGSGPSSPRGSSAAGSSSPPPASSSLQIAPFVPDFSRLAVMPELLRLVTEKWQTPSSLDPSLSTHNQGMEHSLVTDMSALYQRCCALPYSPASSSTEMDVDVASARASVAAVGLDSSLPLGVDAPDFTLQIGTARFPCHRMILYARWPHFAERIRSGRIAPNANVWVIQENPLTPEIVEGLIRYLYTNEVSHLPRTEIFSLSVLRAALLYEFVTPGDLSNQPVKGFELLIAYCRHFLMQPLTVQNCAVLLSTLHEHGSVTQQNRVISYISRNLKQVMESQDAAKALATVPPPLHSKILFSHFSMLQVLEDQD